MNEKVLIVRIPPRPNLDAFFGPRGWQGMIVQLSTALSGMLTLLISKNGEDVLMRTNIEYRIPACQCRATEKAAQRIYVKNILVREALDSASL